MCSATDATMLKLFLIKGLNTLTNRCPNPNGIRFGATHIITAKMAIAGISPHFIAFIIPLYRRE